MIISRHKASALCHCQLPHCMALCPCQLPHSMALCPCQLSHCMALCPCQLPHSMALCHCQLSHSVALCHCRFLPCTASRMHPRRPSRLPGCSYVGHQRYFVTISARRPAQPFLPTRIVRFALAQLRQCLAEEEIALLAYCFMPDHVHLVLEGLSEQADVGRPSGSGSSSWATGTSGKKEHGCG